MKQTKHREQKVKKNIVKESKKKLIDSLLLVVQYNSNPSNFFKAI